MYTYTRIKIILNFVFTVKQGSIFFFLKLQQTEIRCQTYLVHTKQRQHAHGQFVTTSCCQFTENELKADSSERQVEIFPSLKFYTRIKKREREY